LGRDWAKTRYRNFFFKKRPRRYEPKDKNRFSNLRQAQRGDSMRTRIFLLTSALALAAVPFSLPTAAAAVGVGKTCGGLAGIKCDEGLWCDPGPGMCGGADIQGKCVQTGFVCYLLYQPICGCDNKTYSNDCWRQMAKVQKSHDGGCK
jgi:hypothetical protein